MSPIQKLISKIQKPIAKTLVFLMKSERLLLDFWQMATLILGVISTLILLKCILGGVIALRREKRIRVGG